MLLSSEYRGDLSVLTDSSFLQVMALAEAAEETRAQLDEAFVRLRSATHLLVLLLSLWQGLTPDQTAILEATLLPLLQDTPQLVHTHTLQAINMSVSVLQSAACSVNTAAA